MTNKVSDDISKLFGGGQPEDKTPEGAPGSAKAPESKSADKLSAPSEEFLASFRGEDGTIDVNKLAKSAWDTRRSYTTTSQRLAEIEKAAQEGVPETADGYLVDLDKEKLKQLAPKAYPGGDADEDVLKRLFVAAQKTGMKKDAAHSFVAEFYQQLDEVLPEPDTSTEQSRREAAIAAHPNGKLIAGDVQAWLEQKHQAEPFQAKELEAIGNLMERPEGLSVLWRLSRQGNAAPADLSRGTRVVTDPETERREVMKELGNLDPEAWRQNKDAIIARYNRLQQSGGIGGAS